MFIVNDDLSIYVTRGDIVLLDVTADDNGENYVFQPGDVVRFKVFGKKACDRVVLEKDFVIAEATETAHIVLDGEDTKIGGIISKPVDYWYEVELNPLNHPQTIIGYDDDGAKIFKLLPEGADVEVPEVKPEDIPLVDDHLDITSTRPVENQAITREVAMLRGAIKDNADGVEAALAVETVRCINHRGWHEAPENTLAAYRQSRKHGFCHVECDVSFTSDGVAVLLHDATVDRTSNGTGNIADISFADVRDCDFGAWKSAEYAGEKIPTFSEFILLCKRLGMHAYIKLQAGSEQQIAQLANIVKMHGMKGNVTWISASDAYLAYIKEADPKARLGYVVNTIDSAVISKALGLQGDNDVFIDCNYENADADAVSLCANADIPLEVWTVNGKNALLALNPYVSGVTSDSLVARKVLCDAAIWN